MMSRILSLVATLALLSACNSPLLNHVEADEIIRTPSTEKPSECPLSFPKQGLCASWTWENPPNDQDFAQARIVFWKAQQGSIDSPELDPALTVFAKLWMPSMGHGSSPVSVQAHTDETGNVVPGTFDASRVFFSMPGDWEVWLQLKQDGKVLEQAKLDVSI